ncbi:CMD domain protein [Azorhizobium sp. AG788]|uniref:CMD domain protein n=1 Tax=Azorhizobium sp. AG788 TaxID=2183897 RepID=UPI0031399312
MDPTHIIEALAGVVPGSPLATALAARAQIMGLSQASHDAVLVPRDPGGLSHGERAALAARMAREHGDATLAAHYHGLLRTAGETPVLALLADPQTPAQGGGFDPRLAALIRHADLLTRAPRDATRGDIEALKAAGVAEADIVRLAELAAFVNYQVRVIAGLRLLKGL